MIQLFFFRPCEAKIAPLSLRDIIPPCRQIYKLVLVYNFTLTKQCEVSPNLALLSDMLYESEYESQFWLLYDSNKQLMGCGDAYPSKVSPILISFHNKMFVWWKGWHIKYLVITMYFFFSIL